MRTFLRGVDDLLRGHGRFGPDAPMGGRLSLLFAMVVLFGLVYGAVMGSFSATTPARWLLVLYAALKVPMLLLVTFFVCLPSFFVVNTVSGLRDDWSRALDAVVATQACLTLILASLAPLVLLAYVSNITYEGALVLNGFMFAAAAATAQVVTVRTYRPLIARDGRHRVMLGVWLTLYVFVGIQLAWMLRPFVGSPVAAPAFFREGAWGNAYVVVVRLVGKVLDQVLGF